MAPSERLDRADRDEGSGGTGVAAPVEHGADAEEDETDDQRDRGGGVGGVVVGREATTTGDDVEISLWKGTTPELLSPTSNAAQLANTSSAPARKMARPLVHVRRYSTA